MFNCRIRIWYSIFIFDAFVCIWCTNSYTIGIYTRDGDDFAGREPTQSNKDAAAVNPFILFYLFRHKRSII